jgi:hypothetical protein
MTLMPQMRRFAILPCAPGLNSSAAGAGQLRFDIRPHGKNETVELDI